MTDTADSPSTVQPAIPRQEIVLIVDDSLEMRYSHRRRLELYGYEVWEAATGAAGLQLARSGPDAVLLDAHLNDISGLEVCRRLRDDPLTRSVPIIQYSKLAHDTISRTAGLAAGADAYLVDAEPELVIATIDSVLRQRRSDSDMRLMIALSAALDLADTLTNRMSAVGELLVPARGSVCKINCDGVVVERIHPVPHDTGVSATLPLIARGRTIGVLSLDGISSRSPSLSAHPPPWLQSVADRVAISIDNSLLLGQAVRRAKRQEHLLAFATALADATSPVEVAAAVALRGADSTGAVYVNFAMANPNGHFDVFHDHSLDDEIAARWLVVERDAHVPLTDAARSGTPVLLASLEAISERYPPLLDDTVAAGLQSSASVPAKGLRGAVVGAVGFAWDKPMEFTDDLVAHLQMVASITAQAIERTEALVKERVIHHHIATIDSVLRSLTEAITVVDVASGVVDQFSSLADVEVVVVTDADGRVLARSSTSGDVGQLEPGHPALIAITRNAEWIVEASADGPGVLAAPLRSGEEIVGALAIRGNLDQSHLRLCRAVADLAANALVRARRHDHAHATAEVLQRSLLPTRLPDLDGYTLGAHYQPSSEAHRIGGDWYDVIPLDGTSVGLVIGDIAGHGIGSAASMGRLRSIVEACAAIIHTPDSLLDHVDRVFSASPGNMATLLYIVLDTATGEMIWRSAGHPPALIQAADGTSRFLLGGLRAPLGFGFATPTGSANGSEVLHPGETVILYTDGLIERRRESLDVGFERLRSHADDRQLDLRKLSTQLVDVVAGTQPQDDVAVVAIRRNDSKDPLHVATPG